jgi:hypothetical protein
MHLLALADTVATCNTDFAERFAIDATKAAISKETSSGYYFSVFQKENLSSYLIFSIYLHLL